MGGCDWRGWRSGRLTGGRHLPTAAMARARGEPHCSASPTDGVVALCTSPFIPRDAGASRGRVPVPTPPPVTKCQVGVRSVHSEWTGHPAVRPLGVDGGHPAIRPLGVDGGHPAIRPLGVDGAGCRGVPHLSWLPHRVLTSVGLSHALWTWRGDAGAVRSVWAAQDASTAVAGLVIVFHGLPRVRHAPHAPHSALPQLSRGISSVRGHWRP